MARKKKGADGDAGDKEKKGKSNLVPAIVIAVGLILGGKMMGGGGSGATTIVAETTTTTIQPGPVVKLDPITLNMADGRFLRVGLGFQLPGGEAAAGGGGGHGAPAEPDTTDAAGEWAKALDLAIEVLGGARYEELVSPEGREHAKTELLEKLKHAYHDHVEDVYFTEFVLQ